MKNRLKISAAEWEVMDVVWDRAPAAALLHLVRRADLSREGIQELRKILREKENQ